MMPLHAVRDILVFRALMLGDWLCATPALRALRRAAPQARIVACGLPWTAELARRLPAVDEFVAFPGHPLLPERHPEPGALEHFVATLRARRFDLALQLHGSGSIVNALLSELDARATVGFATPGTDAGLALAVPWPEHGSEIERCLALTDAMGVARAGLVMDFPLQAPDRAAAAQLLQDAGVQGRFALVHPGSQLPSRRWPAERFAAVADALAEQGLAVVITGTPGEHALATALQAAARHRLVNLCGRTATPWVLGALVESAALVVSNDTGVSHVAAALATPSVIVASGSEVHRWAPLDRRRHHVHWYATPCRPCAHPVCPTAHECALGVPVNAVVATALELLGDIPPCPIPLAACAS